MNRLLGIHSGRRGGISEQALTHLLENTGLDYQLFALSDLSLESCDVCLGCLSSSVCIKDDGLKEIGEAMRSSSGIVFSGPEYWGGLHAKGRAFWERICFMGRHNGVFPFRHLKGVIVGVSGHGHAAGAQKDIMAFFEDARISVVDAVNVQGAYACFECGLGTRCAVGGLRDLYPRGTCINAAKTPSLVNQKPHLSETKRQRDVPLHLKKAALILRDKIMGQE